MLASPTIAATMNGLCKMTFWYHMRGSHIGTLTVYSATTYGVKANKEWSMSNDQGTEWKKGSVSLTSSKDFQLIFEGKIGASYRGDIAIDDVVLNQGCYLNGKVLPGIFVLPISTYFEVSNQQEGIFNERCFIISCLGGPTPPPVDPCLPKFQCVNSGVCLPRHQVCDFVEDCAGGTDESYEICGAPQSFQNKLPPWKDAFDVSYHFNIQKGRPAAGHTGPASGDATGNKDGKLDYCTG